MASAREQPRLARVAIESEGLSALDVLRLGVRIISLVPFAIAALVPGRLVDEGRLALIALGLLLWDAASF